MLENNTTKKIIIKKVKHAKNFFSKAKGLMFQKKIDFALIFHLNSETMIGASIHMLFVFTPIDVVFLNEEKKVIDLVENLQPWSLNYTPKLKAKYIIELPPKTIKGKISLRDKLEWK